jgi:hypothetical protein
MTTYPGSRTEQAAQAIVRARADTGPMAAPRTGTHMQFTRHPAAWLVVVALVALTMLIPRGSAQAANTHPGQPQLGQDMAGLDTTYFYDPYELGGSSCLHGRNTFDGALISQWTTPVCRTPDPQDGDGFYAYYNANAGPGAWFMKVGMDSAGYRVYTDRLNAAQGNTVWIRYDPNNPQNMWVSITPVDQTQPNPYVSVADYARQYALAWTGIALNDARSWGILFYLRSLVLQDETQHPWIADQANISLDQLNQRTAQENINIDALTGIYDRLQAGDQLDDQRGLEQLLRSSQIDDAAAADQAQMLMPVENPDFPS